MNLKSACMIARKRCYRYRIVVVFFILSFLCLCYTLTLYTTIKAQKSNPMELKAVYGGNGEITDQIMKKVRKTDGVNGATIIQKKEASIIACDYHITASIIGVDAAYLNVALSKGTVLKDEDSAVKLIVNKAALKKLLDSAEESSVESDESGTEEKQQDLDKENWLKMSIQLKIAGISHPITASISGILKEDKKTPVVYMTNNRLDQIVKMEKGQNKKAVRNTIYVRAKNISYSESVSSKLEEMQFSTTNLNSSLLNNWRILTQKEMMYAALALVAYMAAVVMFRMMKRDRIQLEASVTIRMREMGSSLEDLFYIRLLETLFITVIAIVISVIAMSLLRSFFYIVATPVILLATLVLIGLNYLFCTN